MKILAFDQIELRADGSFCIQLLKQIADGGAVEYSEPHRITIDTESDVADQLADASAQFALMGYPAIDAAIGKTAADTRAALLKQPAVKAARDAILAARKAEREAAEAAAKDDAEQSADEPELEQI